MANIDDHPVKVTGHAQQRGPERWKDQRIILKVIFASTEDRSDYILNRNMTIFPKIYKYVKNKYRKVKYKKSH